MNIAVFASGGGSNFQAIADACVDGTIPGEIVLCVASRPDAGVLKRAEKLGILSMVLEGPSDEWTPQVIQRLNETGADFVALAGFMKMIPSALIATYPGRIVNIHPALLPDYGGKGMYGMHVHRAVIAAGESESGATVHIVDEEYDTGPVVAQERVPVLAGDSAEDLAARVLRVEHSLYPAVVKAFAEGRVHIDGKQVTIHSPNS